MSESLLRIVLNLFSLQFDHARKNKRMRTKPAVTVPRSSIKPSILLKESVNSTVQPSAETRAAVQEMLNGNSDIMKYDVIAKVCLSRLQT